MSCSVVAIAVACAIGVFSILMAVLDYLGKLENVNQNKDRYGYRFISKDIEKDCEKERAQIKSEFCVSMIPIGLFVLVILIFILAVTGGF